MAPHNAMAERFEEHRTHLNAVAYRMLGSASETEDVVHEAWIRFSRTDTTDVENLRGWLTTLVGRLCLDRLRSRAVRPGGQVGDHPSEPGSIVTDRDGQEEGAVIVDTVDHGLLLVLETLAPAERLAFVLHDVFDLSFAEIAEILGASPDGAKQLVIRARRRVRTMTPMSTADLSRQHEIVTAFLAASRDRDTYALLALLEPGAVASADAFFVELGAVEEIVGAAAIAEAWSAWSVVQGGTIDGVAGGVWVDDGTQRAVYDFTITEGRIAAIDIIADPDVVEEVDITLFEGGYVFEIDLRALPQTDS